MAFLFLELWSGELFEKQFKEAASARILAKTLLNKYGSNVKWICAYDNSQIIFEHTDSSYLETLEVLSTRNPIKKEDQTYYNNLLSHLATNNPPLFDKYLEWICTNKVK